ncbi:AraC family transcriptional regulator [Chachezhania sediminis]|uniref:AraC family transcriptional regulator n=1 Tax=Chachezhania sediminis TaxID=2599291 RepID=UPI001E38462A|nr:AraC family transcriptional regulator [Chachezhania sediminis]
MFDAPRISDGPSFLSLSGLAPDGAWQIDLAHDRPQHLLIWITRGQGTALLYGARVGVGPHNALFVPARNLFALRMGPGALGHVMAVPLPAALPLPDGPKHLRIREVGDQRDLTAHMEAGAREQRQMDDPAQDNTLTQAAVDARAMLTAIWLARHLGTGGAPDPNPTAARHLVRAYARRIVDHYASGATMADHAEALGVTATYLTRTCRGETGHTAATLLTQRLLHAACSQLIGSDRPAQDIAAGLGFASAAYFSRFLRHHVGQSPIAFRRLHRP